MQKQTPVIPIQNALGSSRMGEARQQLGEAYKPIASILDGYNIPGEKMNDVIQYSMKMLVDHRDMSAHRIARKTVEYFKLKLKPKNNETGKV